MKKAFLSLLLLIFSFGCTRQVLVHPGVIAKVKQAKIVKCTLCDDESFTVHYPRTVKDSSFDKTIPGVLLISQNDRYSIVVRVGMAFDQLKVLKAVVKSENK